MDKRRLLFIDDNTRTFKNFKIAAGRDYEVSTAESIEEALALIDSPTKYDVVDFDYTFDNHNSQINGLDLLNRCKEKKLNCYLAISSAYAKIAAALVGNNAGIAFVKKPLDYEFFHKGVNNYFSSCRRFSKNTSCSLSYRVIEFSNAIGLLITGILVA